MCLKSNVTFWASAVSIIFTRSFNSKIALDLGLPCIESHLCWRRCHQPEWVDRRGISPVPVVVLDDTRTRRGCCCFREMRPRSCTSQRSYFRSTAFVSREPVSKSHYDMFTAGMRFWSRSLGLETCCERSRARFAIENIWKAVASLGGGGRSGRFEWHHPGVTPY